MEWYSGAADIVHLNVIPLVFFGALHRVSQPRMPKKRLKVRQDEILITWVSQNSHNQTLRVREIGFPSHGFGIPTEVPQRSTMDPRLFPIFVNSPLLKVDSKVLLYTADVKICWN